MSFGTQYWDKGLEFINYIICPNCKAMLKPFYYGDKPLNRGVMMDCKCGEIVAFIPSKLPKIPKIFLDKVNKICDENKQLKKNMKELGLKREKEMVELLNASATANTFMKSLKGENERLKKALQMGIKNVK